MAAAVDASIGSPKPENSAATAALHVTKAERSMNSDANRFLDADQKLSSAGAAASLKYANPKDLPSFPSSGLKNESAAGAAATLGWKNQTSFEPWKPDPSSSASKAAMLANDYKAAPLWQPEQSANGAKAALLAAKDSTKVEIWRPEPSSWGNTAATQAFKSQGTASPAPMIDYDRTAVGRHGPMLAATGAMSERRKRSDSTPVSTNVYPDKSNPAPYALNAATHANKPPQKSKTEFSPDVGSSPYTNLPKEFYTSNPPVEIDKNAKDREAVLRASAVAMAQQMYKLQQKQIDQVAKVQRGDGYNAANSAHRRRRSDSSSSDEVVPMRLNNLQEAAQKLAQERLAKLQNELHDEHAQNREYRDYYSSGSPQKSKLSIRDRVRRRTSSDGELDEDKQQSQKIRAQMSLFSSNLSQVDNKKRDADRAALMAAAQRNVTKSLHGMDEKVFAETGKVSQSTMNDWEVKAQAAAQKNSEARMENYGKINIGGGKFIDQSAVDLVARRNVQPILDEINEKAEAERARLVELNLEQERIKKEAEMKKIREKEIKEANKKLKEQNKQEERAKKEAEKAKKEEAKRALKDAAKEEKRKSKEPPTSPKTALAEEPKSPIEHETATPGQGPATVDEPNVTQTVPPARPVTPEAKRTSMEIKQQERLEEISHPLDDEETSPGRGMKGWLKSKFSRRASKSQKPDMKDSEAKEIEHETPVMAGGLAVVGERGHSLDRSVSPHGGVQKEEKTTTDPEEDDIPRAGKEEKTTTDPEEVDTPRAGKEEKTTTDPEEDDIPRAGRSKQRGSSVSTVSSISKHDQDLAQISSHEEFEEAKDHFNEDLAPPPTFIVKKSASPARDSKFHEDV